MTLSLVLRKEGEAEATEAQVVEGVVAQEGEEVVLQGAEAEAKVQREYHLKVEASLKVPNGAFMAKYTYV